VTFGVLALFARNLRLLVSFGDQWGTGMYRSNCQGRRRPRIVTNAGKTILGLVVL